MGNAAPKRFAEGTDVPADKSRAEIEALLTKHGATEFAFHKDATRTTLMFRMQGVMVRQRVQCPGRKEHEYIKPFHRRTETDIAKRIDAEWRRLWRAQLLIVKAKLEIIASGGSTFEREFLADMVLPNGETVVEAILPRILDSYQTGKMPMLMLSAGGE